jgi:hypothetical protein
MSVVIGDGLKKDPRERVPDVGSLSLVDVLPKSLPSPAQNRSCCRQCPCSAPTVHQIWLGCPSDIAIRYSNADVNRAASLTISSSSHISPPLHLHQLTLPSKLLYFTYSPVQVTLPPNIHLSSHPSPNPSLKLPSPKLPPTNPNPTHLLRRYLGIYLLRRFVISPSHQRLTWTCHARNTCTSALSHRVANPTEFPELPKIRNMYRRYRLSARVASRLSSFTLPP